MSIYLKYYVFFNNTIYKIYKQTKDNKKVWLGELNKDEIIKENNRTLIFYDPIEYKKKMNELLKITLNNLILKGAVLFDVFNRCIIKQGEETKLIKVYELCSTVNDECPVCLESKKLHHKIYKCSHSFCAECAEQWTGQNKITCPICRALYNLFEYPIK